MSQKSTLSKADRELLSQTFEIINKPVHWQTIRLLALYPASFYEKTRGAVSADGFDAEYFYNVTRPLSHGERLAADFILSVFNSFEWRFDVHEALQTWDSAHREIFTKWAQSPWWE